MRHYTSRAGDPHRHLHVQINARVFARSAWRGLHSVGVVDSIGAINGIGHAAVMCDPELRGVLAAHGYTLDPTTGEVAQLTPYAGSFSARAAQITRNIDRYEAQWRTEHPGQEPGPTLRRAWDRRAWSQARPDKVAPVSGDELRTRWVEELHQLGFTAPAAPMGAVEHRGVAIGRVNRDAVADLVLSRLGARRSSWNAADIRGEVERIIAAVDVVAPAPVRHELVEDLTDRTVARCVPLLDRDDVPEHVRSLTSRSVLDVEADLIARLTARAEQPVRTDQVGTVVAQRHLDHAQREVVAALGGTAHLLVIEGAAGAGKTTTLAAARELLEMQGTQLMVVTPTLKAAQVAEEQLGAAAFTSAWLVHQHGFRWDEDGHWSRTQVPREDLQARARLLPGDVLLVDEAGMLDQDVARALLTIADESHARVAFVGDRHQLPAVGRGGVLDHAARWAPPETCLALETVHRFTDPEYADLTLLRRTGQRPGEVFDQLNARGLINIHPTEVERLAALTEVDGTIIADTREQVTALNTAIRDQRLATGQTSPAATVTTAAGERLGAGDLIATRRNDRDLGVANRDQWTVTSTNPNGSVLVRGRGGVRSLPADYVREHVELAYATTVHGAQGDTVDQAHLLIGEATGAAAAYVGMTRGRHHNTAHLVVDTVEGARAQWVDVFSRDRADLGPAHAADTAAEDIDRYGPQAPHDIEPDVCLFTWVPAHLAARWDDTQTPPANPLELLIDVVTGELVWTRTATILAALLALLLVLLVATAVGIPMLRRLGGRKRVDRAATRMGRGKNIAGTSRRSAAATAQRLGLTESPGLQVARTVAGNREVWQDWESVSVDVWGPRAGKSSSRAIPAIMAAPGAVLATSNKRDLVDATRAPRAEHGSVWVFDPPRTRR